jgi:hypothetical protein
MHCPTASPTNVRSSVRLPAPEPCRGYFAEQLQPLLQLQGLHWHGSQAQPAAAVAAQLHALLAQRHSFLRS